MAIRIHEKFEGHMETVRAEQAENVKERAEHDEAPYDDMFEKKLSDVDRTSFQDGNCRTVEATEDLTLYRVYGKGAGKQGRFLTAQEPKDRMEAKRELALNPGWKNSREYYCEVQVPKGTVMHVGKAERQKAPGGQELEGGAEQILVEDAFAQSPGNYGEEHKLGFAGNYHEFEEKAAKIEKQRDNENYEK